MSDPKLLGYMYIATRPCGKLTAAAWDDDGYKKETAKSVASWIARGDEVKRIARYSGDPQLEWRCDKTEDCECKKSNG